MRAFLGLLLAMGIVRKATVSSYWNGDEQTWLTHTPSFGEVMTRNRFQVCFSRCSYVGMVLPEPRNFNSDLYTALYIAYYLRLYNYVMVHNHALCSYSWL